MGPDQNALFRSKQKFLDGNKENLSSPTALESRPQLQNTNMASPRAVALVVLGVLSTPGRLGQHLY